MYSREGREMENFPLWTPLFSMVMFHVSITSTEKDVVSSG